MDIMLVKTPGGALAPVDAEAREMVDKLKLGQGIQASVRRARNVRFHRKGMALFRLAYDVWEPLTPLEYKGLPVAKDFERFRKDMTILAGFYKAVYNARGEVRLEAESLRFSSMSEERFEEVFNAVLNVVWSRVLKAAGYASVEDVEEVIEELLRFDQ
ncbi:hypothetical protein PIGHUM_04463 [Pigmentiphaga humi]|uniref:DUF1367 family protein n=1 Tax=Pigmentiphaga humi TaxID=2478468 RepID=A0A3P4B7S5_9BURK|nr:MULTISPECIES: DUF1367 family protein [Alcaligenaceae]QBH20833.1 DUF1367 family protein [Alcaligenes faecalis]VCU72364.1 hypothetical protein PIGHUM_04463 [Pigmentiphaga humi]HEJ4320032.1 DUF1367 family protein [Pseudomonas aeruginosa]